MLGFAPIAFAAPWVLTALAALPVLWWLLRVTPPAPRTVRFPAIRLLRDLIAPEETPARTPWWLLLLRLIVAALVILALSGPLLNPRAALPGGGPLLLVVDDGWAAGRDWPARKRALDELIAQADRQARPVILLTTAPPPGGGKLPLSPILPAPEARRLAQALEPHPWPTDRAAALETVRALSAQRTIQGSVHAVWLSDGLGDRSARDLAEALQRLGSAEILDNSTEKPPHLLLPPATEGTALTARVARADTRRPEPVTVRLSAADGRLLTRQTVAFEPGQASREVRLDVPTELRNDAASLRVEGDTTAGATVLLDERWRRRPVGLVSGRTEGESQPLLSDLYYLDRALSPFNEVRRGGTLDLLKRDLAVLILSDVGALTAGETQGVEEWVRKGGVLLRFAGPRLAQHADPLIPVRLRLGDRALGGALSWSEPAKLQPFPPKSPFEGLAIPPDVQVNRQVLAEPALDLAERSWARLADGTPLVTAEKRGDGWIVLVHTTASPDWSNLPLSGLFVDMLRRVVALSGGVSGAAPTAALDPVEVLDGTGRLDSAAADRLPDPRQRHGVGDRPAPSAGLLRHRRRPPRPEPVRRRHDHRTAGRPARRRGPVRLRRAGRGAVETLPAGCRAGAADRRSADRAGPARPAEPPGPESSGPARWSDRRRPAAGPRPVGPPRPGPRRRRRTGGQGHGGNLPGLYQDRRRNNRRHRARRAGGAGRRPQPADGGGNHGGGRRRSRTRRAGLLPAALLARFGSATAPVRSGPHPRERLSARRRHHPVRHPRPVPRRRTGGAATAGRWPGHPAAGPGAARPCAAQVVLFAS